MAKKKNVTNETNTIHVLEKVSGAIKNSEYEMSGAVPSIFLIGERGSGITKFSKEYEKILFENHVYKIRSEKTFLELVFPAEGSEMDYQRFLQSPKILASLQNEYHGVFAISFHEWKGKELLSNRYFKTLINYIDNNKDNIYFVFHVTPTFEAIDELRVVLSHHVNLISAELERPDKVGAASFVLRELEDAGMEFSEEGKEELREFVANGLDVDSSSFAGYKTLKQMSRSFYFELTLENARSTDMSVTVDTLKSVENRISFPKDVVVSSSRVGFGL